MEDDILKEFFIVVFKDYGRMVKEFIFVFKLGYYIWVFVVVRVF